MTEHMSNVDNFWLCMDEPTNLMVITGFMEFDRVPNFDRLCETLERRLLRFERFRQRVVRPISGVRSPDWELDPYFDIRSHIHRVALQARGQGNAAGYGRRSDVRAAGSDQSAVASPSH